MAEESQLPFFGNVDEWVRLWLAQTWRPDVDGRTRIWSAQWWRFPEARARLEALWLAWEAARLDTGSGMSAWWVVHADHHLPIITSMDGPFASCASEPSNHSRAGTPLACAAPEDSVVFPHTEHSGPCLVAGGPEEGEG